MRFCSIASSSKGNCIYVGSNTTHILIDVGISMKRTVEALNSIGIAPEDLSAILITHEHVDHIAGLGPFVRKYKSPIYATDGTLDAINTHKNIGNIDVSPQTRIIPNKDFQVGDMKCSPIPIYHDAAEPVGYKVMSGNKSLGIMTDTGMYDNSMIEAISGLDALFLEANHDVRMLESGAYPYSIKQRILGDYGHLSNIASGRLINRILHDNLQAVVLGHLSQDNNLPELAYETVRIEMIMGSLGYLVRDMLLKVASPVYNMDMINVT